MGNGIEFEEVDFMKLARAVERDCQEGVHWERRKLEWILEREREQAEGKRVSEAA